MATEAQAVTLRRRAPRRRLADWLALLPVRLDDRRLWLCVAIGVVLRSLALEGSWLPLRTALAWAASHTLAWLGTAAELVAGPAIALGAQTTIGITVRCSHIEVFALVLPLLWNPGHRAARNLGTVLGCGAAILVLGVARIDLSIALYLQGMPWAWAHDALLGVFYFVVVAPILSRGAWRGTAGVARRTTPS